MMPAMHYCDTELCGKLARWFKRTEVPMAQAVEMLCDDHVPMQEEGWREIQADLPVEVA